ncbi:MAG: hypothetical protein ACPL7O_09890, partial [Armatimonadota bacterium]
DADLIYSTFVNRQRSEAEIEDLLCAATSILSGSGGIGVSFAEQLASKTFDMSRLDEETSADWGLDFTSFELHFLPTNRAGH